MMTMNWKTALVAMATALGVFLMIVPFLFMIGREASFVFAVAMLYVPLYIVGSAVIFFGGIHLASKL